MIVKADFHIHSTYSFDSFMKPKDIIINSVKKGLNVIAITDHNTIKGAIEAQKISQNKVSIIIGTEIKTNKGDVIGLFLNREIKSREYIDVIKEIKRQNGLAMLPHPFRSLKYDFRDCISDFDLVETLNARNIKIQNDKAKLFAIKNNVAPVSGSDAHLPLEIGRVRSVIHTKDDCLTENLKNIVLSEKIQNHGTETPPILNFFNKGIGFIIGKYRGIYERSNYIV